MLEKGIFTISIDVEMAWGSFDHGGHIKYKEAYQKYRFIIDKLLELFKIYGITATWAIVGHLFLDSCKKENGKLHPDIIRPKHGWFHNDWLSCDPGTDIFKDKFWYGSDIVKMIRQTFPKQEIASHSFCHPIFSDRGCSKETAESDIAKCVSLAKEKGINLNSFTFPRNLPGHLDVLAKYGFRVFRGKDDIYCKLNPKVIKKIYFILTDVIGSPPPVVLPNVILDKGLVEIPSSMLFRFAYGVSRFIPKGMRFRKAKKGIDKAIRKNRIFHMWFHPISFAWKTDEIFYEFEKILEYAAIKKQEGSLKIITLKDIGETCLKQGINYNDKFNPQAIVLHDKRTNVFKADYSDDLTDYHSNVFKYGRKKIELALLSFLGNLSNGNHILDIGSGTGYYLNLMCKRGFNCIGVDLSENMLQQSKHMYPELVVQLADARKLPFLDDSFDAVVSIETLRYFSERKPLLKEIFRVVKPGGLIFITAAPFLSTNIYGIFNTLCRILNLKSVVSCFQSFETVVSLRKRLQEVGFKDISIRGYFFGPYFLFDKLCSKISSFSMRRFENFDDKLAKRSLIKNFSNHLVAIARKPQL